MITSAARPILPFKSVAAALLFCVALGPIGLLYASFRGALLMIPVGILVVCARFGFPIILMWIVCCVWGVGAVERYNRNILKSFSSMK